MTSSQLLHCHCPRGRRDVFDKGDQELKELYDNDDSRRHKMKVNIAGPLTVDRAPKKVFFPSSFALAQDRQTNLFSFHRSKETSTQSHHCCSNNKKEEILTTKSKRPKSIIPPLLLSLMGCPS